MPTVLLLRRRGGQRVQLDWSWLRTERGMLRLARGAVLAVGVAATGTALCLPADVFDNVMFAWAALGSGLGRLAEISISTGTVLVRSFKAGLKEI
jgi:Na+/proline symporter